MARFRSPGTRSSWDSSELHVLSCWRFDLNVDLLAFNSIKQGSEKDLEPDPVKITRRTETVGGDDDRIAEFRVLPVEEDPGVEIQIPVEAHVSGPGVIAPEIGIRESRCEDFLAEFQRAEAHKLPPHPGPISLWQS